MNSADIFDRLKKKFGSHRKVAEALMIHENSYCNIRLGRVAPSKRLVAAMKNLLGEK